MRGVFLASVLPVALTFLSCTRPPPGDGPLGVSRSPIAYGSPDTTHTAVVAVLAPYNSMEIEACTGTIVQVSGQYGYVLTAAHCCNQSLTPYVPTVVVLSSDYAGSEQYALPDAGAPKAPAYPVVPGSVSYDPMYDGLASQPDHDFCMLKFSGATASTPTLALPTSTVSGLAMGSPVLHVGFGVTEAGSNTGRRAGTDTVNVLTSLTLQFNQGGDADIPGTCAGDSGGPSLFPASAPQAQQVVVAVQSYGNSMTCSLETSGTASLVSSAIGPGGFITSYLPASDPPPVPAANPLETAALALGLLVIGVRVAQRRRSLAVAALLLSSGCGAESALDTSKGADGGSPDAATPMDAAPPESDAPLAPLDVRLDPTFGSEGELSGELALWTPTGVAVDAEGRVLVSGPMTGPSPPAEVVRRFSSDGILDGTFGASGQVTVAVTSELWGQAIRSFPDGSVGVLGAASVEGGDGSFLFRFAHDGAADSTFGGEPVIAASAGQFLAGLWAVDGSGFVFGADGVARFDPQGMFDATFGSMGHLPPAAAGVLSPDGSLLTGTAGSVSRYLASGALDPIFGRGGTVSLSLGPGAAPPLTIASLLLDPGGDVVVVGSHPSGGSYDLDVTRISATGVADPAFAGGGFVSIQSNGSAAGSAYLSDGRTLAWTSNGDLVAVTQAGALAGPWSLRIPGTVLAATLDPSQRLLVVGMATDDPPCANVA